VTAPAPDPLQQMARSLPAEPRMARLVELTRAGWRLLPIPTGFGDIVEIQGILGHDGTDEVDVIRVHTPTEVLAMRTTGDIPPATLWRREDSLDEVVDALLELPLPHDPRAPRLVIATAPPLWQLL
jgi:hypothetical protein